MKKKLTIIIILSSLISCVSSSPISGIDRYIKKVDVQKDYIETITEYNIEASSEHDLNGGGKVSFMTDDDGVIVRILAYDNESYRKPTNYKFYYQNGNLIFSNLVILNEARNDTVTDIDYYFLNKNLIKKKNRKQNEIHSEYILEMSEYYKRHYEN